MVWLVSRESAITLAGIRAVLLQFAHPAVAAGVDEHSDFRSHPLPRLWRSLDRPLRVMFGDSAEAARQINQAHRGVRGPGYRASDPDLQIWVGATLIDTALEAYQRFFRPLSPAEREEFYQESKALAPLLGVPKSAQAETYDEFAAYWSEMLRSETLRVDDRARQLAAAALRPHLPLVPGAAWKPLEVLTTGLLPERFRDAYGLPWRGREQRAYRVLERIIRASRHLPAPLREMPVARSAMRRQRRERGRSPISPTELSSGSDT